MLLATACAPFGACASTTPGRAPTDAPGADAVDDVTTPPEGSKRLPSSIACEPQPPCVGCRVTTGGAAPRYAGSLDKEVIRAVILSHTADAKACYDAVTEAHPEAAGKLMVKFGIAPSGRVVTSCLESSALRDAVVERCMVDLPLGWTFPAPQGGGWVVVSYPYVFTR